jgi:hypothetical protein
MNSKNKINGKQGMAFIKTSERKNNRALTE